MKADCTGTSQKTINTAQDYKRRAERVQLSAARPYEYEGYRITGG